MNNHWKFNEWTASLLEGEGSAWGNADVPLSLCIAKVDFGAPQRRLFYINNS